MKYLMLKMILVYKKFLSPFLIAISGPTAGCKFYPTCSEYALRAVSKHGAIKGALMSAKRIVKCSPISDGGVDFVDGDEIKTISTN